MGLDVGRETGLEKLQETTTCGWWLNPGSIRDTQEEAAHAWGEKDLNTEPWGHWPLWTGRGAHKGWRSSTQELLQSSGMAMVVGHTILPQHFQPKNDQVHGTAFSWGNMPCMLFIKSGLELTSSHPNPRFPHGLKPALVFYTLDLPYCPQIQH